MFLPCCKHKFEHVPHTSHLINNSIAQMHYILQYLYTYLHAFSWLSFYITLLLLCSVMLIIFSCSTVWLNITMTLSSLPPRGVWADIDAAISSLIICLFHFSFLHRRMPFHTTIPKRIQTMWVQYGLLSTPHPPSACRKPWILPTPTYHPCHPFLQPHPPLPSSLTPPCWCPLLLQSQAPGLSVYVSEVTLLYGELVWQGRGRPT